MTALLILDVDPGHCLYVRVQEERLTLAHRQVVSPITVCCRRDAPRLWLAERLRRAREQVAAMRETVRRRGVDLAQLPDPVEELSKVRDAGHGEP